MSIENSQNLACWLQCFITFFFPEGPVLVLKILVVWSGPEGPQFARSVGTLIYGFHSEKKLEKNHIKKLQFWTILLCYKLFVIEKRTKRLIYVNSSAIYTRRVARQYGICWLKKELSMAHDTLHIFFKNKTFLFVKIESWNF